jgi:hypothetical protein
MGVGDTAVSTNKAVALLFLSIPVQLTALNAPERKLRMIYDVYKKSIKK